jgi:uncharacterized phage protein gp47/JayE
VINITGTVGIVVPAGSILTASIPNNVTGVFQTTALVTMGTSATPVAFVALTAGQTGLVVGSTLSFSVGIAGIDGGALIASIVDGVNAETDDELRARVLQRIREPPMGGDADDYVEWATGFPGVTRAWTAPNEMGVGTVTVRFMMDDLRADPNPLLNGFPTPTDVAALQAYLDNLRPVAIKDFFVEAPIPEPINFMLSKMSAYNVATTEAITVSVTEMLEAKASPSFSINGVLQSATTIYASWVSDAVLNTEGVEFFDLIMMDHPMPNNGCLAVMGTITYG